MSQYRKYPSTPHLPWSPSVQDDDTYLLDTDNFIGKEVVVTEKLDGENTSLYPDYIHARSITPRPHASRDWVKGLHGQIKHLIPQGWRLCGENLYALHSIYYGGLESYFYLFSIWDENNRALSWDETKEWAELLGLPTPREFYRGIWNEKTVRAINVDLAKCEGYVVRTIKGFAYADFPSHIAKWVRQDHIQTDEHWMNKAIVPNGLKGQE